MSRLVMIRVGNPDGLWAACKSGGKWSSPECHEQAVRNMLTEGYSVYAIFLGTGDKLLMAANIKTVRERLSEDDTIIPDSNDLGLLRTVITFDPDLSVDLQNMLCQSYRTALDYIQYRIGSQLLIPNVDAEHIIKMITNLISLTHINMICKDNEIKANSEYWLNLNVDRS
uniref:Uncharacterized protein n=1 Tax=viral metagenome TaxID=1070528 RepID=A0A6C0DIT7_9ZZZZ